jgi:hypothetical protein
MGLLPASEYYLHYRAVVHSIALHLGILKVDAVFIQKHGRVSPPDYADVCHKKDSVPQVFALAHLCLFLKEDDLFRLQHHASKHF